MVKRVHHKQIPSTQTLAKEQKGSLKPDEWVVYTADAQTAGIGTRNRKWASPPDVNIYATFSFLIPADKLDTLPYIPQITALAVAQMLQTYGLKPTVKWVNDVLLDKRKMCGILSQSEQVNVEGKNYFAVFLGIGVNVNMSQDICRGLDQPVTSMSVSAGKTFDKEEVFNRLTVVLQPNIELLISKGFSVFRHNINLLLERYDNEEIIFDASDTGQLSKEGLIVGRIDGMNENGHLQLKSHDKTHSFHNGRVLKGLEAEEALFILNDSHNLQNKSFAALVNQASVVRGSAARGQDQKPLFKDDYMPFFAMSSVEKEAEKLPQSQWSSFATRHKYFIQSISKFVKSGDTQQVVFIGGGFTTVPVRKSKYSVRFFEVDHQDIFDRKKRIYDYKGLNANATWLPIDHAQDNLVAKIREANIDATVKTHFILEGSVANLPLADIDQLIKNIRTHFPNCVLSFDYAQNAQLSNINQLAQKHGLEIVDDQTIAHLAKEKYQINIEKSEGDSHHSVCTLRSKF